MRELRLERVEHRTNPRLTRSSIMGSYESGGSTLEMICADFLGANIEAEHSDSLTLLLDRCLDCLLVGKQADFLRTIRGVFRDV